MPYTLLDNHALVRESEMVALLPAGKDGYGGSCSAAWADSPTKEGEEEEKESSGV